MKGIDDLIEEVKGRPVWWALCIFFLTYFLTHASNSMWMNLPMAVLILCGLRFFLNQNEFRRNAVPATIQSHLNYSGRRQLSLNDARLSTTQPRSRRKKKKKKINSPVVEDAINDFVDKIVENYVKNLWYSSITPDKDFLELIRGVIMNAVGEISVRVKEINIVCLLSDIVDLIGDHLESFRRFKAAIGKDVMKTLSSEKRDEMLKRHLMTYGELYPALVSKESEHKVLQKIVAGILSLVLRPRESQCPLVQTIARELLTCSVVQPLVNFVSPERIKKWTKQSSREEQSVDHASSSVDDESHHPELRVEQDSGDESYRMPEVATQRRTEALHKESQHCLKIKSWVLGDNIEKLSSRLFAVYCITVTDTENKTRFVMRRYSNFERLHRQSKENPNYNLLLPPKHIFSSRTEDAVVHRHCIQLEKYLQDLLSIAIVAEQHEVWDFLSESSKKYSLGESSSWMRPNVIEMILNLVDKVFRLNRGLWSGTAFAASKKLLLIMRDTVDDWFLKKIHKLRNENTVAHGIRGVQDILWPNGVFFTRVDDSEEALDQTDPSEETFQMADQLGGEKVVKPSSLEQQLEAGASKFKKFLLEDAPTALVGFVKQNLHRTCPRDILYFTQSKVCIKQLAFAILELLLQTVFPELQDLLRDIRENPQHGRSEYSRRKAQAA
ncbi:hypothetical protein Bca4012_066483 [Brassica carinata]